MQNYRKKRKSTFFPTAIMLCVNYPTSRLIAQSYLFNILYTLF